MPEVDYRVDWHDDLVIFTLSAEKRLNALSLTMVDGMEKCLDAMSAKGVRAIVITGLGKAFCAGTDLHEASELSHDEQCDKADRIRELFFRLQTMPLTGIAAINGHALGGGLELAMACTLRMAHPNAGLGLPEVKLAVIPCYGGTQLLPSLIGKSRAADLMLTGRTIAAEEAHHIGLVNRLADAKQPFLEQALSFAREVSCHSQRAIADIRQCLAAASETVTPSGLALEGQVCRAQDDSRDAKEGLRAFLEKRPPQFSHH